MRDIPGHEGRYAINEDGTKLLSYPKPKKMWQGGYGWTKERFLSIKKSKDGYWHVTLSFNDEKGRRPASCLIHRLVALAFIGLPTFDSYEINHKDKDPSNNHFSNLEWVSRKENMKHSWENGRVSKPYRMTIEKIKKVYELDQKKIPREKIAKKLKIKFPTVRHIVERKGCYSLTLEELEKRINNVILPPPAQTR